MDILIGILTVVEVIVCILMILIVLMQRPRQEGLGASFGDGAMTQLVGAQTTNVLQKGTVYLALTLFVLTISLAVLTSRKQAGQKKEVFSAPPAEAPAAPVTPAAEPAKTGDATNTPAPAIEVKPSADAAKAPEMKEPAEVKVTPAPADKPAEAAPKPALPAPATTAPAAPAAAAAVTPVPEAAKTPAAPAKNP
jgi:preprotein translocase subunit SecG